MAKKTKKTVKKVAKPSVKKSVAAKAEFDGYKDHYGTTIQDHLNFAGQSHDFYLRLKAEHLLATLKKDYPGKKPLQILDVGCGHGLMHPFLTKQNVRAVEVTGVDPAATVIEEAKKMHKGVKYLANDGNKLPFKNNAFDAAFTVCTMHHVPPAQWQSFMKEMRRVVKPGGKVFVYEHNPYNPLTQRIVRNCPIDVDAVLLTNKKVNSLMKNAGLKKRSHAYIIFLPFDNALARAVEKLITWLPLGAQYVTSAIKAK